MIEKETNYFSELKASLEEAVAFAQGDESKCRVSVQQIPMPPKKADVMERQRVRNA